MQRFYGGDPERWISMPIALFRAYAQMLPRLLAEERLTAIDTTALAYGRFRKLDEQRAIAQLQRATTGPRKVKPSLEQIAAMGIAVVEVPVSRDG